MSSLFISQRPGQSVENTRLPNLAPPQYGAQASNSPTFCPQTNSLPIQGHWTEDPRGCTSTFPRDGARDIRVAPSSSGRSSRPPTHVASEERIQELRLAQDMPPEEHRHEQNRKRTASRDFHRPYMKEMAAAHAENRDPVIQIPVSNSGTVLGLKSPWHRAARLCARQTLNFKIRSYKFQREYWMSQVQNIAEKLEHQFSSSSPLDINYLGKFLKNTLKNDRKSWKKYFEKNSGMRHPRCPEEAFTEWRKYWLSAEGKDESIQMTEMRKGKNKAPRIEGNSGEDASLPQSPFQVCYASLLCEFQFQRHRPRCT